MSKITTTLFAFALLLTLAVPAIGEMVLDERGGPVPAEGTVDLGFNPNLDERVEAFIQLSEPAVVEHANKGNSSAAAKRAQANKIDRQQADVRGALEGETEIYALRMGANGIAVQATVGQLLDIAEHDDVISVSKLPIHSFDNSTSVPWIQAAKVWEDLGYTGSGLSIGIIDTGIDYLHADFGGPGTTEAYDANDPTTLSDVGFTGKVAGGMDFVGDDYNADPTSPDFQPTPHPDEDPLDCNGHGTHVAGSAAGQGVLADGSIFTGPYDLATFEANEFEVGPGVAPEATLYALKVFGCDGSTNVTVEAIEWALDPDGDPGTEDGLDVINMSLGSDFGQPNDPTSIATNNAMEAGMLVVSAAGNDGPVPYVHGSPGSAELGISVAASVDNGVVAGALVVNSPAEIAGQYESQEAAFTPPLEDSGPVIGDLVVAQPLQACGPLTNAAEVAGEIAFIQRGTCPFVDKILNAQAAGAIGVVVYNNLAGSPFVMGGSTDEATIPAVMISLEDGNLIQDTIEGGATVNVTLSADFEFPKPELADTLADFTSQGPRGGDLFGPDVAAPGFSIDSAATGTGFEGRLSSGTSMATPHVAGLAALMRQAHPGADTAVIKAMIMNSTVDTNGFYATTRMGTGVVRVDRALALDAVATPAGVSFGRLNPTGPATATQTVTVADMSGQGREYAITHTPLQEVSGVSVSVPDSVSVPANGSATFEITMDLSPAEMPTDDGFFSQTEVDGLLDLVSGESELRVGYLAVVDPASQITASTVKPGQQNSLLFSNDGAGGGWLDTFTHLAEGTGTLSALGIRDGGGGVLEFGVASSAAWDSRSRREVDILIDVDQDGTHEWAVVAADLGYLQGQPAAGQVVTAMFDLVNGGGSLRFFAIADLNDHSQILPIDLATFIGDDGKFDFLAVDLDFDTPTGFAEGSVDLKRDVEKADNIAGALLPGEEAGIADFQRQNREALLALYQNNPVPTQFEVIQLKPGNRSSG